MSLKSAATKVMQKAIEAAPDKWLPGGTPDPILRKHGAIGTPVTRIDGRNLQPGPFFQRARKLYWEFAHSG